MDSRNRIWTTNGERSSNNSDVISVNRSASTTRSALRDKHLNPDLIGVQSKFRRKYYQKCILAILIFIIIVLVIIVIILATIRKHSNSGICNSKQCLRASAGFLYSMDVSVDPCEDFYKFTCGNWETTHPMMDSLSSNDWFKELQIKTVREVRDFLKSEANETEPDAVNKTKLMYQACMDVELLDELDLEPLMRYLKILHLPRLPTALNITLPAENKEEDPAFDWIAAIVQIKIHIGIDAIYGFEIIPDFLNRTRDKIAIGFPGKDDNYKQMLRKKHKVIATLKDNETDDKNNNEPTISKDLREFISYVKKVLTIVIVYLYPDINSEEFQSALEELTMDSIQISRHLYNFQSEAENLTKSVDPLDDVVYLTIKDLQNETDKLIYPMTFPIWDSYINIMMKSNELFNSSEEKILTSRTVLLYLQKVSEYLIDVSKDRLQFFLWMNVVLEIIPHTTSALRKLYNENLQMLSNTEGFSSRSFYCANGVSKLMEMAVSFNLASQDFILNTLPKVKKMLFLIHESLNGFVKSNSWMDDPTKKATLQKSAAIKSLIGFPDWIMNGDLLDEYYLDVKVSRKTHLDNMINILVWQIKFQINAFKEFNDVDTWKIAPSLVNAYFDFQANTITVPIAILQYPFYNLGLEALNYGAIGTVLGHELMHGFDDNGRLFDRLGNLRQWWSNQTTEEYIHRAECFVEQYSQYQLLDIGEYVDGELTLGENIADNGGMREAFHAYKKYVETEGMEDKLPGMENYSHEQLFFISFGYLWCETLTPAASRLILEDVHCPGSIRLKGVLSNSEEFANTFKCKRGSAMFPDTKKCKIW